MSISTSPVTIQRYGSGRRTTRLSARGFCGTKASTSRIATRLLDAATLGPEQARERVMAGEGIEEVAS